MFKSMLEFLFRKNYFPRKDNKIDSMPSIFKDPKHDPFKEAMLDLLCKWMAEELEVKNSISPQFEVYQRLLLAFTPREKIESLPYMDPLAAIQRDLKKELAAKN